MFLAYWFLWLIIYSFIGWVYESTLVSTREKRFVNRGFLAGPILPVYGFGALISIFAMSGRSDNLAVLFLAGTVFSTVLEYFTSWVLEKLFKARWWDYTNEPFNLHGRVFLLGAVVFGTMSALLVKYIHPAVTSLLVTVSYQLIIGVAVTIFIIMMIDLQNTVTSLVQLNNKLKEFQFAYNKFKLERFRRVGELREEFMELFEQSEFYQQKLRHRLEKALKRSIRMVRAYPKMKSLDYKEAWERLTRDPFDHSDIE